MKLKHCLQITIFINFACNGLLPRKRVLPSWMKQPTSELENRVNVITVAEEGKDQIVVCTLWISRLDFFNFSDILMTDE